MASTVENFTENDIAGAENDFPGAEDNTTGSEDNITGAEIDYAGIENNMDGVENDMDRGENMDGDENDMDGGEIHMDGVEAQTGGGENHTGGAESNLAGVENIVAEATDKTENQQQGHSDGSEVKSSEKRWPGWPGESVFRMLVPSHKVGGIIGRKGEFIKKMCEESRARIKILEAPPGAPERAVIVSAKEEQDASISPAMDGLLRIHKRSIDGLDGEKEASQNAGTKATTRLLVNATQAGTLIGKNGSTIKSIQETSNCIVRVLDDVPPFALQEDKIVEILGQPIAVHKALELIASHLRKYLVDRSVIPLFESQMSRPTMVEMPLNLPPPQHWGHPQGLPPPSAGGPSFGGNHPQFMPPPRPRDNFYPPHDMPPYEKTPHHGISAFGRDVPPMGAQSTNQHGQHLANQVTQHIQVPISYADAVIGAAGASISYIRRASGATITIQETRGIPGEMTVEINGSATQVQTAQQLIQNFMADAAPAQAQNQAPAGDAYASSYGAPPPYPYSAPPGNAPPAAAAAPPSGAYGSAYGPTYGY